MSKASVEQALTGLVPALNGPLPPELIELTLSLLARSRSVASSLKSDEEIARPYACAQLACERSKKRFNLPSIVSRPPCPPRIYKKLYNYLSSALPTTNNATRDPQTPSKKAAFASARTTPKTPASGRRTPRSTRKPDGAPAAADVPEWVMPAIRALVKKFDVSSTAPHIFTGVETILPLMARMSEAAVDTPSKRHPHTSASKTIVTDVRVLALIGVVFLAVFAKTRDADLTEGEYEELRKVTVETQLRAPVAKDIPEEDLLYELQELMDVARVEGWLQMEWFLNIAGVGEDGEDGMEMEGVEMEGAAKSGKVRAGGSEHIGLGTMMQDATDYLGARQRGEYEVWKARVMARVQEIEAQ